MRKILAIGALGLVMVAAPNVDGSFDQAIAKTKNFGCYKVVNASSVRIRKRPYLWAKTIDYAKRGEKVVKNRRFCSIRGSWCRIQAGKTSGWIGKKFLKKTAC